MMSNRALSVSTFELSADAGEGIPALKSGKRISGAIPPVVIGVEVLVEPRAGSSSFEILRG